MRHGRMAGVTDTEPRVDSGRLIEALRRFVFDPGEEPVEDQPGDPSLIWTDEGQYEIFPTDWLIRADPTVDDVLLVVSVRGPEFVLCYGLLFGSDGAAYLLNDRATVRDLGRRLGRDLDPVAFAQVLAALHSYPSDADEVSYPSAIGDLAGDPRPAVQRENSRLVITFGSTVRYLAGEDGPVEDTLAWRVEAVPGEPARWERRLVARTPVD